MVAIIFACLLLLAVGIGVAHYWGLGTSSKPLGEAPRIEFPPDGLSQSARKGFLHSDSTIVTDVKALPRPILQIFTEREGSRLLMANPGSRFQAADVITDASVPRERLIFAGVQNDKCFVHYEQGGIGLSYVLLMFRVTSAESVEPLWKGYCAQRATNIQDLRVQMINGGCR